MFDGSSAAWHASLSLRVCNAGGRSRIASRHRGPLRLQKALYPEGPSPCHAVVLHPPGGIAGGDALEVDVDVAAGAHALVTTPGAAKWYKANGRTASQCVRLRVSGALEWLPQETIVFDAADARSAIAIDLRGDASMIGWEIVALGRAAAGERFTHGAFTQTIRLSVDDELAWIERTRIAGGDALLESPIGLAKHHVFGCLWAAGLEFDDDMLDGLRAGATARAPLTRVAPRLLVARASAASTQAVRSALIDVWTALRPLIFQRPVAAPRVWAT